VREQAEGSRNQVKPEPRFHHAADRSDRDSTEQHGRQRGGNHRWRESSVLASMRRKRQPVQSDQLLAQPPSGSAEGDLFQQVADERLSRTIGVGASQEPRHRTVSARFAALTSRSPAVVIEK
jgi:hypothetical protein